MVVKPSAGWRTRSLPSSADPVSCQRSVGYIYKYRLQEASQWSLTVVPCETMAVGREAGIAQDGDLGQADAHDSQVPRHGHDGGDTP